MTPPADGSDVFGTAAEGSGEGDEDRPRRKPRNKNMTPQEKLVLIRGCCEHADKYRPGNKSNFWLLIRKLLRDRMNYDLADPRQTISRWVETRIDELVDKEMRSGTEVERNDFKIAVKQFANRSQAVADGTNDSTKTPQQHAAENLEVAGVERSLGFDVDVEPTSAANASSNLATGSTGSATPLVAPGVQANKRRRVGPEARTAGGDASKDAIFLAGSFRESITVLAEALRAPRQAPVAPLPPPPAAPTGNNPSVEQRIDQVESALGDVRNMVSRILQAIGVQKEAAESGAAANHGPNRGAGLAGVGVGSRASSVAGGALGKR